MKQTRRNGDLLYLPQEIIRNILKRLPVKSLIRFQIVCKDWKNLIKNPSFIADHLQQSSNQNPSLILDSDVFNIPFRWCLHLLDCEFQVLEVQKAHSIDSLKGANIVGSCNGLLCLEIDQYNQSPPPLSLWNPATTVVRHVPKTTTNCPVLFDECVTGFGFSPIVNDYKIVRAYADDEVNGVEVFSLSRGKWKVIDIGNLKGVLLNSETITVNGAIFWTGLKLAAEVIVSFDIAKEVFTVIPIPDLDYDADEKLTVYKNKLAILCGIWEFEHKTHDLIDLWVLDEGTCASSETWGWTKIYTSSLPLPCVLNSMIISRNEIVYKPNSEQDNGKGRRNVLYMMNPTTNEVKRFVIPYWGHIRSIFNYVESLVPVGNNYIEES